MKQVEQKKRVYLQKLTENKLERFKANYKERIKKQQDDVQGVKLETRMLEE